MSNERKVLEMKHTIFVLAAILAFAGFADGEAKPISLAGQDGGQLIKKGTFTGKVVIVDTQDRLSFDNVKSVAELLTTETECNIVAEKSQPSAAQEFLSKFSAAVAVVLIDDASQPLMLLAPEDHWGVVNVAKLVDDLPSEAAKARFIDKRARKELIRAFSMLCGGGASQFQGNLMSATTLKQVDYADESIPLDMKVNYWRYLKELGVTKKEVTTYKRACREGWAPAPTNQIQQVIWDKAHQIPADPMKIKFDKVKGR